MWRETITTCVLLYLSVSDIVGVIQKGRCTLPEDLNTNITNCNEFNIKYRFKNFVPVAHLPNTNDTLNIFYNPYGSLDKFTATITCNNSSLLNSKYLTSFDVTIDCERNEMWTKFGCDLMKVNYGSQLLNPSNVVPFWVNTSKKGCEDIGQFYTWILLDKSSDIMLLWNCIERQYGRREIGAWFLALEHDLANAIALRHPLMLKFSEAFDIPISEFETNDNFRNKCDEDFVCDYHLKCMDDQTKTTVIDQVTEKPKVEDFQAATSIYPYILAAIVLTFFGAVAVYFKKM